MMSRGGMVKRVLLKSSVEKERIAVLSPVQHQSNLFISFKLMLFSSYLSAINDRS